MKRFAATFLAASLVVISLACSMGGEGGGPGGRGGRGGWGGEAVMERATVVEVEDVAPGSVGDRLTSSAVVESEAMADLYPVTSGIVQEILVDEGDPVRRDQVLAVVDNASAEAGSARSRAEVERLSADVARLESLYSQGAVSSREVEEARYSLRTARASARESGALLGQTRIKSPIDGVVAVREIRVGELASSGTRAFQVVDLDRLRVVASLPERDLPRVAIGQPVKLVSAYDPSVFTSGSVSRISPVVDSASGTFRVTVDLSTEQTVLRPGQFVSVEIEVARHEGVLVVPREAVVYEDGVSVVYRMVPAPEKEPDSDSEAAETEADSERPRAPSGPRFVAERAVVEVGLMDDELAELTEGVSAGDRVVVVGQSNLRDGAAIRTPDMAAAAPTPEREEEEG